MESGKIHVKIGDAEFLAEGSEERIADQFHKFLAALEHAGVRTGGNGTGDIAPVRREPRSEVPPGDHPIDPALVGRVFGERNGILSLHALPRTENANADALLMILYGYRTVRQEDTVIAGDLMASARQSGVPIERVDRTIAAVESMITQAGARRGRRYGLNNRGVARVEEVLKTLEL